MMPSTAISDIPSVTTSATDVDVDGSQGTYTILSANHCYQ